MVRSHRMCVAPDIICWVVLNEVSPHFTQENLKNKNRNPGRNTMKRLLILLGIMLLLTALTAEDMNVSGYQNDIRLIDSNPNNMVMEMTLGSFTREAVQINGQTWYNLLVKKAGMTLEAGLPQVPVLASSVIIPGTAAYTLNTVSADYVDIQMQVAPSKGNLTRDIDPATVPYSFAPFYNGTESYPVQQAYLSEPFILRDYRGITVRFQPFEYFPATGTLRVYTRLQVALNQSGTDMTNAITSPKNSYSEFFADIYENMFINFNQAKYPTLVEAGRILVIKNAMFDATIAPWVDWKRQNGYRVDVVDVSVAGPTANQIKTYIQGQYDLNDGLMFVQIMGDAPQVPTLSSGGGGSDPSFALLAGGDSYPDIFVGRFSAQTVPEMQTQITRSVWYERDVQAGATWAQKAMGIASNEGGGSQGDMGESDQAHMELIRTDLLNYGYTSVDQMYQATGANASQVGVNINQGRGFVAYVGHGSDTSWVATGFNNTNVNALVNDNMLPAIVSVACVNGNFVSQTCFAEAWMRSVNEATGNPAGAIAFYGSTINQGWNPPMRGQDEIVDLMVAEQKRTIGGLFYNGSSKMIEVYGASGASEFKCWTIFGDASLMMRTKDPVAMNPSFTPVLMLGMNSFSVQAAPNARVTLSGDGLVYGTTVADAAGNATIVMTDPPQVPMDLTLTITAQNKVTYLGVVQVLPANGPYLVVEGLTITDDNNNIAEFGETINLGITLSNVGSDAAEGTEIQITSADPFVTILTSQEVIGNIAANAIGSTITGFSMQIAGNIPDQHLVNFTILISLTDGNTYEYDRSFAVNAPSFSWGGLQIAEIDGNGNGRVDAGETLSITVPVTNTGHAGATNLDATVIIDVNHLIDPIITNITELPVNASASYIYQVTFSSQIPVGTIAQFTAMIFSGEYTAINTYSVPVGLMMEDFENGTFTNYPWSFTGGNWALAPGSYNGSNTAKSATITHNQSTSMSVSMNIPDGGDISFWKKVSSEANYDFLKFYINGILKDSWSGTSDSWSQLTYVVQPGQNMFKWEYIKDGMVSSGSDCAWIDDIVFPTTGGTAGIPVASVNVTSLDFGTIAVGQELEMPVLITNSGTASLLIRAFAISPFYVAEGDASTLNLIVPAGETVALNVKYIPYMVAYSSGTLELHTDDFATPRIDVELNGVSMPVSSDDNVNPVITELRGNYPNPFNPTTTIAYSVKESGPVQIDIYNLSGQKVRTLVNSNMSAGNHTVVWNGKDSSSRSVGSGVYFFKMQAGKYTSTKKMIMMK